MVEIGSDHTEAACQGRRTMRLPAEAAAAAGANTADLEVATISRPGSRHTQPTKRARPAPFSGWRPARLSRDTGSNVQRMLPRELTSIKNVNPVTSSFP